MAAVHVLLFALISLRTTLWADFVITNHLLPSECATWCDSICISVILTQGFLVGVCLTIGGVPTAERAERIAATKNRMIVIVTTAFIQGITLCLLILSCDAWYSWWIRLGPAIIISQGSLLAMWVSHGGKPTPWRAVAFLLVAAVFGLPSAKGFVVRTPLIEQTINVMVVLLLLRFLGLRLRKPDSMAEDRLQPFQFSIKQALSWLTASVIFMSAMQYLKYVYAAYLQPNAQWDARHAICFDLSNLGVALAAIWLSLGNRWIIIRCLALLAGIGICALWEGQVLPPMSWYCAIELSCEAAVTMISLLVVRLAGYRLTWHWPFRRPKPDQT
jgi:hypothetical protein